MTIDRSSPVPLYYQLKRLILNKIEDNELKPGDILPTEQQIQEMYDLSRTTVRQALSELADEGRIIRHRGRGTFITKPKVRHMPEKYPDLSDYMMAQGIKPGWRLLSAAWVDPTEEVCKALSVSADEKVFQLERLRFANDEPIGYQLAHLAPQFATYIDPSAFTEGGSLRYLNRLTLLEDSTAHRTIEAIEANEKFAELLGVAVGAALLRVTRMTYTQDFTPIELFSGVYRGDRFQYHINNMRAVMAINA